MSWFVMFYERWYTYMAELHIHTVGILIPNSGRERVLPAFPLLGLNRLHVWFSRLGHPLFIFNRPSQKDTHDRFICGYCGMLNFGYLF